MRDLLRGTGLTFRERDGVFLIVERPGPVPRQAATNPRPAAGQNPAVSITSARPLPEPLIIIGQRMADQRAIAIKGREVNIADALASDDVQRLPDSTVVDALRRVPGISVLPVADNEHPRDMPIAPVVRGLTQAYNNVTVNGLPVASTGIPDAGSNSVSRGVRLDILPASVVSSLVAIKTFTPELDPNAIGGAIDLRTRSAFETDSGRYVSLDVGLARSSRSGEVQPQAAIGTHASLTAARTLGADDRFGIVISANYRHLDNNSDVHATSDSNFLQFFGEDGRQIENPSGFEGIAVPRQDKYWHNSSGRRHWGITARAEAKLADWRLSVLAGELDFRDGYTRNEIIIEPASDNVIDLTPTSGHFDRGTVQVGYRAGTTNSKTRIAQFAADWQLSPIDELHFAGGLSRAKLHESYEMVKFTAGSDDSETQARFGFDYDSSSLQHSFNLAPNAYYDLSQYGPSYWRNRDREARARIAVARAGWRRNMEAGADGMGFAAGLSLTETDYFYDYRNQQFRSADQSLTLDQIGMASAIALPFHQENLTFLIIDPTLAWRMFEENRSSIIESDKRDDDLRDDFSHGEVNLAGYGMARWSAGPVELRGGFRLEHSRTTTDSFVKVDTAWRATALSSHYLRLLPSLLANWQPDPRLRVRAAYSRTIGRPDYEDYAPRSAVEFAEGSTVGDPEASGVTVTLGNPDILPRISDNFDLSLEWEMPGTSDGFVSAALFHKAIGDEIFTARTQGYAIDGIFYRNAEVRQSANANAAHISGIELSATLGSLEAVSQLLRYVGFSANWTVLDGGVTVPRSDGTARDVPGLVGQPDRIGNLSLFYNDGAFELRGAVNATGLALRSLALDSGWQDLYWAPRRQFDIQARYRIKAGPSIILDLANITEARLTSVTGPGRAWLKDSYSVPRTIRLSLVWGLGS